MRQGWRLSRWRDLTVGNSVNIEVDLIARHVERLMTCASDKSEVPESTVTMDLLARSGFLR